MTRKQSCCSERCCSRSGIQSCCSGVGPDLAHLEFSPRFFMILESSSLSGLRSHLWDFTSKFFFSVIINLTISEIWLPSSTYDFSPTREAQFLDTAVVYVSHIPLRLVSEQTGMIYFSSTSYDSTAVLLLVYSTTIQLYVVFFTPREGAIIPLWINQERYQGWYY